MAQCMAPGCNEEGRNYVGLRLRKPSTLAVYAPNYDAFLCKEHAEQGARFTVTYEPAATGTVETVVQSGGQEITRRITPIKRRAV